MEAFNVLCLGSRDDTPVKGNDCTHFLLNGHILIDCGTSAVMNLLNADIDPDRIDCIVFTHMHEDHCMGLPSLLYYLRKIKKHDLTALKILGPKETVKNAVTLALDFCIGSRGNTNMMPQIVELNGGETLEIADDSTSITVKTLSAWHATPALCYRFEKNGKAIGFTGDTYPINELKIFFDRVDALVCECSFGRIQPHETEEEANKLKKICGHSSATDEANLANIIKTKNVYLVHSRLDPDDREKEFSESSQIPVKFIKFGDRFSV